MITDHDIYLFKEGTHGHLYRHLGCHLDTHGGARFAVWAPNARSVSVAGDWNGWSTGNDRLVPRQDGSGVWEGRADAARRGDAYKFRIEGQDGRLFDKADPFAISAELPPATASRIWSLEYAWGDATWMADRAARNALDAPISVYEAHLGSWRRRDGRWMGYREIAGPLAEHVTACGFTHVELLPIMEHPFYGSWGYQTTGYFAPTSRYGTPQDLMYLVDMLHRAGIGVILDWVPSHFPSDAHGLAQFDGTFLYEHADPRQGWHPQWDSSIFNYERHEVRSFLLSSALFWLECFHADGLRVDAVASMLYLDYARSEGEWIPNRHGGRENLGAVDFLKLLNEAVYRDHPDCVTIAEESTAWPMVSRPTWLGGLGFGMKWNMGWMNDTLGYFGLDPVFRRWHHDKLTFSLIYAFNENFMLPLSHDEVVHGKGSLASRMPGDGAEQLQQLRSLLGFLWTHPGKKLLFMGGEFGQRSEWGHDRELDWWVAGRPEHAGVARWVGDLNRCYRSEPALHEIDFAREGFEWIDGSDADAGVLAFLRRSKSGSTVLVACNFAPVLRVGYRVGVPTGGWWREVLNSDAHDYGGAGAGNFGGVMAEPGGSHGRPFSLALTLPPTSVLLLRPEVRIA